MIVEKKLKKRDGLRNRGIEGKFIGEIVIIDGEIKKIKNRFKVDERREKMKKKKFKKGGKIGIGMFDEWGKVNMKKDEEIKKIGRRKMRRLKKNEKLVIIERNIEKRMKENENMDGMIVKIKNDRVEKKGNIVVEDGDEDKRKDMGIEMEWDKVVNIDDDIEIEVGLERGIEMKGRNLEGGGIIRREILRRRKIEEKMRKGREWIRI